MNKSLKRISITLILTMAITLMSLTTATALSVNASLYASKSSYTTSETVAVTLTYSGTTFGSATAVIPTNFLSTATNMAVFP